MSKNFQFMKINIINISLKAVATFFINKTYLRYLYAVTNADPVTGSLDPQF